MMFFRKFSIEIHSFMLFSPFQFSTQTLPLRYQTNFITLMIVIMISLETVYKTERKRWLEANNLSFEDHKHDDDNDAVCCNLIKKTNVYFCLPFLHILHKSVSFRKISKTNVLQQAKVF